MSGGRKIFSIRHISVIGIMAALSVVLVLLIHFPMFAPFLEYDPADIPILITTFLYGPVTGFVITIITSVVQGVTVSADKGIYGIIMHMISTGTFALVAGLIYSRRKTLKRAVIALAAGTLCVCAVMCAANTLVIPLFNPGMTSKDVLGMLLPVVVPFNLIKCLINSAVTFLVYKPISKLVTR